MSMHHYLCFTDSLYWLSRLYDGSSFSGASGLVHFDEEGERNLDYSIYDLQHVGDGTKFVPILNFDSQTKMIR